MNARLRLLPRYLQKKKMFAKVLCNDLKRAESPLDDSPASVSTPSHFVCHVVAQKQKNEMLSRRATKA